MQNKILYFFVIFCQIGAKYLNELKFNRNSKKILSLLEVNKLMDNKSRSSIYFFLLGSILCLLPVLSFPWINIFGISVQTASELLPSMAKVGQNQQLQLEMPIYLIRQSFIPYFSTIHPIFTYLIIGFACLSLLIFTYEIKIWSKISTKQFALGIGLWLIIFIYKLFPFNQNEFIHGIGNISLVLCMLSIVALSICSSQAIPHLILQFGQNKNYRKTKRNYSLLYAVFIIDLGIGLYNQHGGNPLKPELMLIYLCLHWLAFWFQISSNGALEKYRLLFAGLYLVAIPGICWFYFHQNDAAIRFAFEWNFRSTFIMAFLFPIFIYSNFQEIFNQNLALHTVIFKAHRIKLYLYQVGVLIVGLTWTFAQNATLFHVFLAGYYNQVGDLEQLTGKPQIAQISYQMAQSNSRLNLKSNIELAKLSSNDEEKAQYLSYTLNKRTHPFTYLFLGNLYKNNDHPFQALFTFQEGFEKFPESAELATAIAVQFEKLNQPKDASTYYQKALNLDPKNTSLIGNQLYAKAILDKQNNESLIESEENLAVQANQLALNLLQHKSSQFEFNKDFQLTSQVQDFAYLYNASLYLKDKMPRINYSQLNKNEALLNTFPELKTLEAWQDYYQNNRLKALQKISFLKETYAGKEANPYEQVFYFWHNTLNEPIKSIESLKGTPEQLLEKFPFSVDLQNKYFPILNAQKKEKIAYDYALAAIQFNPNKAELYPNYILQAIQISELSYAEEAYSKLKTLSPSLYQKFQSTFEHKRKEIERKRAF